MPSDFENVLKISQALIQDEIGEGHTPVTIDLIYAKVDQVLEMKTKWKGTVNRLALIKELETRFSIWIGKETFLSNDDDHVAWLSGSRKEGWRYWPRYRQWLEDRWAPTSVEALDQVTDRIVGLLEHPDRPGPWDRRGLVVGHVQSGKTANYTGLICKAADAGYKLIVVLAGLHSNLRSQTQMRLDEGFLGYETMPRRQAQGTELRTIGVGLIDSDPTIRPDYVTNRANDGDFKKTIANNMGISPGHRPWLFVVKKNPSVLRHLVSWVEERVADAHDSLTGRPIVSNLPLLVIDDEADHASVDTGEQLFDENGQPDLVYQPKKINQLIRRLLHLFNKSAFVGYTATPFANIFIHERGRTEEHGEDLFPRSFIVNLPTPSNYAGPVRVFGLEPSQDGENGSHPLPLVRHVNDHAATLNLDERQGWMPPRHRNGHRPLLNGIAELPKSLQQSIQAFILGCTVRDLRGQANEHTSMLVHVTKYTSTQKEVANQVRDYLVTIKRRLKRGVDDAELIGQFNSLWCNDFIRTTASVTSLVANGHYELPQWSAVEKLIPQIIEDISVREINGHAGEVLDYEQHKETGLKVIAIGGDKLARGLTLEGLIVSYFLRASRMYDTLMQMGRWFGYRPGYLDLCRLYTTPDLEDWFQHITEASEELREEFNHMYAVGGTPREYGIRVKSHPLLMVTSRVKMRNSEELRLSFAGESQETIIFHRDTNKLSNNVTATDSLIRKMGEPILDPKRNRLGGGAHQWKGSFLWEGVPSENIVEFLRTFLTHEDNRTVIGPMLADYIDQQQPYGELAKWSVALLSGEGEAKTIGGLSIKTVKRSPNLRCYDVEAQKRDNRFIIRRILAPRDEAIDLDQDAYQAALELSVRTSMGSQAGNRQRKIPTAPSGLSIRRIRGIGDASRGILGHPERGLLLLYPLSPLEGDIAFDGPVVGFGVSFPESRNAQSITYKVNNVYWAQEYGAET